MVTAGCFCLTVKASISHSYGKWYIWLDDKKCAVSKRVIVKFGSQATREQPSSNHHLRASW